VRATPTASLPRRLPLRPAALELLHFGLKNARACLFPAFILAMLALTRVVEPPLARYDFLLLACLGMQALMFATGLETRDELKVITLFHLLGLGLELFKVHVGSWSYPEAALAKVGGVPLYSGFMYASVASYMIQAWRLLGLRFMRWPRAALVVPLGVLIYANFFANNVLPDQRGLLILAVLWVFRRTRVVFTSHLARRGMPLVLAFLLIGVFVWLAENVATYLGAWQYPHQQDGWRMVDLHKLSSWALLVIVSLMIVVQLKHVKGRRPRQDQDVIVDEGHPAALPSVRAHACRGRGELMRRFLYTIAGLALAAALYYGVAAPRIALAAIERAASADDVVALAYHVDVASVRQSLLEDFGPSATAPLPSPDAGPLERMATSLGQALGVAVGTPVRNTVADLVASPEGILQLLGGVQLRPLLGGALGRNTVAETFDRATTRYAWPPAFVLRVPTDDGDAATEFVLRPRGWVWKIAEVRLPSGT
jgi:uncharacterized membrane protein YoaT (DUF817 family)